MSPLSVADEGVVAAGREEGELTPRVGRYPAHDEPDRGALLPERGVGDLRQAGARQAVGDGAPGLLRQGGDRLMQAFMERDGDGEAHVSSVAGPHHLVAAEAGVCPQGDLPSSSGLSYPLNRLGDETRNAPGGVGRAAPQAGMQDLACACGHGEQGVVARTWV